MIKLIILFVSFIMIGRSMLSQKDDIGKIPVMNFDQLEPYLHLEDDSVHLVNFWATWCVPCREEMPAIQAVEEKYSNMKFKVLLVSLDFPGRLESSLIPFLKLNHIKSEVILLDDPDQNRWIDLVDKSWSGEIPYTIIYGKGYRESYLHSFNFETLDAIIHSKLYSK